ncbi:MAG: glycosyltransferase family 4 protein [Verrucomicrobia bacterium]|nr:glycosyltransferase family 4 protein [Verrucomicrobiota bacterium]
MNTHFRGRRELPKGNAVNPLMLFIDQRAARGDEDAGSRQMLSYLKLFAGRGYQIVFWSYDGCDDPQSVQVLNSLGIKVLHKAPYIFSFEDWIKAFGNDLKVVFLSRPHVAVQFLNAIKKNSSASIVYYGHDLHVERMNLQNILVPGSFTEETVEAVKNMEEECWDKSDVILYPSIDEVNLLREKYPHRRINILPIECRADTEINEAVTPNDFGERDGMLFVGGFSHLPNQDAVLWFLKEVYPLMAKKLPDLHVSIAGNAPTDEIKARASKQVVVTGRVSEEELRSLYNKVKVVVAPLRIGAGVKGKVVESLRMGVPVVTTSIGVQGLPGYEDAIAVADDPADFAKAVQDLLQDEALWQRRREAGLKYYRENFSESVVAPKVLDLLNGDR